MKGLALLLLVSVCSGCTPRDEPAKTVLPTKAAIDSVSKKLDAAQQDADKRRADADRVGQ